ncbi:MAG: DNA helicase HerA-like ATPase [Alphaproteobacteria bacterium]|jgi:DNA helicase HerA-like ATPase
MTAHFTVGITSAFDKVQLPLKYANRHGLITGATGTGKTITLQHLAEQFSKAGVPVFASDIKGDLSGLYESAENCKLAEPFAKRAKELEISDYCFKGNPVRYWDVFGEKGIPIRATISEIGPVLLARMLELNDVQEGVLNIMFRIADEDGLLLVDLNDLRDMLHHLSENAAEISARLGNVSKQSIATIQRNILTLENQGAAHFFGEPALDLNDLFKTTYDGLGFINILNAEKLMSTPRLYAAMQLWLISELFETLPEVGDSDKPKAVFFFDEAHLLFEDAPKALIDNVERAVRLIRSKGIGIYFVTQNPSDVPDGVSSQLATRIGHALRAYTPKEQKTVKIAAETFRQNPDLPHLTDELVNLGIGEALISCPDDTGAPQAVQKAKICPPQGQAGVIDEPTRQNLINRDDLYATYKESLDPESASEILKQRAEVTAQETAQEKVKAEEAESGFLGGLFNSKGGKQSFGQSLVKSIIRQVTGTIGRKIGRELIRGLLGGLAKK